MKRLALFASLIAALLFALPVAAQNPCGGKAMNPCGGKSMKSGHAMTAGRDMKDGNVFYLNDPMNRNTVSFTSRAPLEDIIGTSNQLSGHLVFDPERPMQGGHGEIRVPVASLNTGIPLRDEHLQGGAWLNATEHPEIVFNISKVKKVKLQKSSAAFKTWQGFLAGTLSFNGNSKEMEIPVRVTFLAESEKTRSKLPGDLLAGRATFSVSLKDFGVIGPPGMEVIGSKVSEAIGVEITFTATSEAPKGVDVAAKSSNPCGAKAMARNPCSFK